MTSIQLRHAKIITTALPVEPSKPMVWKPDELRLIVTASGTPMWGRKG